MTFIFQSSAVCVSVNDLHRVTPWNRIEAGFEITNSISSQWHSMPFVDESRIGHKWISNNQRSGTWDDVRKISYPEHQNGRTRRRWFVCSNCDCCQPPHLFTYFSSCKSNCCAIQKWHTCSIWSEISCYLLVFLIILSNDKMHIYIADITERT